MKSTVLIGRIFFSWMFLYTIITHFSSSSIGYAESQGLPLASVLVPLSGILAFLGGLSILLGYKARIGAWLIVAFLVPVTLIMHNFWAIADPSAAQNQMIHFNKNLVMLGGALLIAYFGSGPFSIDSRIPVSAITEKEKTRVRTSSRTGTRPAEREEVEREKERKEKERR